MMTSVSWRSDFIWHIYWLVLTSKTQHDKEHMILKFIWILLKSTTCMRVVYQGVKLLWKISIFSLEADSIICSISLIDWLIHRELRILGDKSFWHSLRTKLRKRKFWGFDKFEHITNFTNYTNFNNFTNCKFYQ